MSDRTPAKAPRVALRPAAGDSGTPLAETLGIRAGSTRHAVAAPADYGARLGTLPAAVRFAATADAATDIARLFATRRIEFEGALAALRRTLRPDAVLRVSWPKRAAQVATDVTEDTIRAVALPLLRRRQGVRRDRAWSAPKLVVRKPLR